MQRAMLMRATVVWCVKPGLQAPGIPFKEVVMDLFLILSMALHVAFEFVETLHKN